ncbi:MAG: ion transporter [Myxococcota bacterium]
MSWLRRTLHDAFHRPDSTAGRRVDAIVWLLIIASTILLAIDLTLPAYLLKPLEFLQQADNVILGLFAVELALRVLTYRPAALDFWRMPWYRRLQVHFFERVRFCLRPMILIDILTVLGGVPELRGLRALRLLRLLRSRRIFRYANPFGGIARAFEENRLLYLLGLSIFGIAVLLGGVSFYLTEQPHNERITDLPDALWWSIVTITTVGYGDLTPVTNVGRVVAGSLMMVGMITLALFAGIVGSTLMSSVLSMREESFRMSNYLDHIVVCGYDAGTRMLLDTMSEELDLDKHPVVIFAPYPRPPDIPSEFFWMQGDPTKESELEKIRLAYADAAIVVGTRDSIPQQADAHTILVTFTIRRYLKRREPLTAQRKRPLYLVAEILDAENVEHARTAGADEVIQTTRMGFSLLAHAVEVHGTATLVGELADVSGNSLFVGQWPASVPEPWTFDTVSRALKDQFGVLAVGVRSPEDGDMLNPHRDLPLTRHHHVIYMATKPVLPG